MCASLWVCLSVYICECLPIRLCLLAHRTVRSHSPRTSLPGPLSGPRRGHCPGKRTMGPLTQSHFLLPPAHPHSWGAQAPTTQTHSPDSLICHLWLDQFLGRVVRDTGGAACAEAGPRVSALSGPHWPLLGGHLQSPLLGAQPAGRACEAGREGHQVAFHCGLSTA